MLQVKDIEWGSVWVAEQSPNEALELMNTVIDGMKESKIVALDFETGKTSGDKENGANPLKDPILCCSFCFDGKTSYSIRMSDQQPEAVHTKSRELFDVMLNQQDITKLIHNIKFDAKIVYRITGRCPDVFDGSWDDTMVMAYLLDENKSAGLKKVSSRYLYVDGSKYERRLSELGKISKIMQMDWSIVSQYNCADSWMTYRIYPMMKKELETTGLDKLYCSLYKPLLLVLLETEIHGFMINRTYLDAKKADMANELVDLHKHMKEILRYDFNPRSVPQVRKIIDKLGLTDYIKDRTVKTGISTDYDSLVKLSRVDNSGFIPFLLQYRDVDKNRTFVEGLIERADENGIIRTNFLPNGTVTGRLCVAKDTVLETDKGNFEISELDLTKHPECSIITHKGRYRRILNKVYKGEEELFKVTDNEGNTITCTENHRFLTPSGWRGLNEIQTGDSIYSVEQSKKQGNETNYKFVENKIVKIDLAGVGEVWDIEVEEDHSYIAQGYVNHNSSRDPNLQNLPGGKPIRTAFMARPGKKLVINDYSQIELRLAAWYAQDQVMLDVFRRGGDIHASTAIISYNLQCTEQEVKKQHKDKRDLAKSINFGVLYGLSAKSLAEMLKCSKNEASAIMQRIMGAYRRVADYKKEVERDVIHNEYAINVFGRRRRFPGLRSMVDQYGERDEEVGYQLREAFNFIIQSTGADICDLSIVYVKRRCLKEGIDPLLLAQVHDEMVWEIDEDKVDKFIGLLKEEAETILVGYPIPIEVSVVSNWGEKYDK